MALLPGKAGRTDMRGQQGASAVGLSVHQRPALRSHPPGSSVSRHRRERSGALGTLCSAWWDLVPGDKGVRYARSQCLGKREWEGSVLQVFLALGLFHQRLNMKCVGNNGT